MNYSAKLLKSFCDDIHYLLIYRYLCGINHYHLSPYQISSENSVDTTTLSDILGSKPTPLINLLLFLEDIPITELNSVEYELIEALAKDHIIALEGNKAISLGYQLICYEDFYLLIDGYINFKKKGIHRSYIGIDTFVMLYYVANNGSQSGKGLDLCTGSGVGALALSKYCHDITATDIDSFPLKLSDYNVRLNDKEHVIKVITQDFNETLHASHSYDFITCNPPFVAFPESLEAPVYAKGFDKDGLRFYRDFFAEASHLLTEKGVAYFVGDFPGNDYLPHYYEELKRNTETYGLSITLLIDNKLNAKDQCAVYPHLLKRFNPQTSIEDLKRLSHHLVFQQLKASYYYLTTLIIEKTDHPSIQCFHRYKRKPHYAELFKGDYHDQ